MEADAYLYSVSLAYDRHWWALGRQQTSSDELRHSSEIRSHADEDRSHEKIRVRLPTSNTKYKMQSPARRAHLEHGRLKLPD